MDNLFFTEEKFLKILDISEKSNENLSTSTYVCIFLKCFLLNDRAFNCMNNYKDYSSPVSVNLLTCVVIIAKIKYVVIVQHELLSIK